MTTSAAAIPRSPASMVDLRLVLALFLLLASTAQARPGDLDRSFGDRGRSRSCARAAGSSRAWLPDGSRPLLSVGTFRARAAVLADGRRCDRPRGAGGGARGAAVLRRLRADARRRATRPLHLRTDRPTAERDADAPVARANRSARSRRQDFGVDGAGRIVVVTRLDGEAGGPSAALPARRHARRGLCSPDLGPARHSILVRRDGRHPRVAWPRRAGFASGRSTRTAAGRRASIAHRTAAGSGSRT